MSSQTSRAQPYSLSTPRVPRTPSLGATALARAQRGLNGGTNEGLGNDAGSRDGAATDRILAAISKVEREMIVLSDHIHQELSTMALRVEEEIATLTNKVDEDLASVSDKLDQKFITVSNKLDQATDAVDALRANGPVVVQPPAASNTLPGPPSAPEPWNYSNEVKDRVYHFAYDCVSLAEIASYTALESPNGDVIVHSLFNTIKRKIREIPGDWATPQLPPVVNGIQDVAATQRYTTLVKDAGKHARERLHKEVLHNIRKNEGSTVPSLKRLAHRIAKHCNRTEEHRDVDTLWAQTAWTQQVRIAYLRREAIRIFQSVRAGGGTANIWHRVDSQLHLLAQEEPLYASAFYKIIYDKDRATFDGKGYFVDVDVGVTFDLPSDEEIREKMQVLEGAGPMALDD
ncbi:uncharacterized protein MELLADRAFT_87557 [Melampsora larici-populina 98AG31]|uniref:Uncharacterized protein n=1 Tax=Melampsora larici-populina (strain 98AG31 / pathotype 3-4-7) TaxID=747676 RepID=F4RNS0_MELLP|nr:uncharacterized protein MELLADRAFT_87557 [Melampsora larici-populina 98AG31]EGG06046.1 hypothetical protein MELLADRAFT_87557 [Melampsora larici-populina 98AG31]